MPSIDEEAKRWQMETAARVGRAIQKRRGALGWSAAELSRRTAELGYPISRVAISKIESNSRLGKLDLSELLVLAAALKTSPINLAFPGPYMILEKNERGSHKVEALPGQEIATARALEWFSGLSYWQEPDTSPAEEEEWIESTRMSRTMMKITNLIGRKEGLLRQAGEPDRELLAFYDDEIRREFTELALLQRRSDA